MIEFVYKSKIKIIYKKELENLLFFNIEQKRVLPGIEASIEKFGIPKIIKNEDNINIVTGKNQEVQSLFALTADNKEELAGVIIFTRVSKSELSVIHMAIKGDFVIDRSYGNSFLALRMIEEVKKIASRIKGIEYLTILYSSKKIKKINVKSGKKC